MPDPVNPHDDSAITSDGLLVRNIHPVAHIVDDKNTGGRRISSMAFSSTNGDPHYGMSVDIGQKLLNNGKPLDAVVPKGMGAVSLPVGGVRGLSLMVGSDPEPIDPYHGQVWPVKKKLRSELQSVVIGWIKPITGVALR